MYAVLMEVFTDFDRRDRLLVLEVARRRSLRNLVEPRASLVQAEVVVSTWFYLASMLRRPISKY